MSASPTLWSNVAVSMQSALATALTISAITKASTGVVTYTGTDPSNGDYIVLEGIQGMYQVDSRVFRVANVNGGANTLELEGEDTSAYDTFVASGSPTASVITFGTSISSMTNVNSSGGDFEFIDTTTIHINNRRQIPGLSNPTTYTFDNIWDISDSAQTAMKTASNSKAKRAFKFVFGTGGKVMLFTGYVGFSAAPGGSAQALVTAPAVITQHGTPTFYSS